jgi:putative NADH-flavin reductase
MNIVIVGASGFIGSALVKEAVGRGHRVTAIARDSQKIVPGPRIEAVGGDVTREESVFDALAEADVAIVSLPYHTIDTQALLNTLRKARVARVLFVGGAGSLEVAPGKLLIDTPTFPEEWKGTAWAAQDLLYKLRGIREINWTYVSPSAMIAPGERTGTFRLGTDRLLVDAKGESRISVEDFAMAMVDEIEDPKYPRTRFTVGY